MHAHTVLSDGSAAPDTVLEAYRRLGCSWVALTDHDRVTRASVSGVVTILGCERTIAPTTDGYGHMLLYGIESVPAYSGARDNVDAAPFSVLAHPVSSLSWGKWTVEEALASRVRAVEINSGYANAEGFWDTCLTAGVAPFCTVGDDMHGVPGVPSSGPVGGRVMAYAESCTANSILDALSAGAYYCTAGPRLSIVEDGMSLAISSPELCDWWFIGAHGAVLAFIPGATDATYRYAGQERYVRCKAVRVSDGKPAWTNPIFFADWRASMVVNGGSRWTASRGVRIEVTATSSLAPVVEMRTHADAEGWSEWRDYAPDQLVQLGDDDGDATVRLQIKDGLGTVFEPPSATVVLDREQPLVISLTSSTHPDVARWYSDRSPSFSWSGDDESGVAGYSYALAAAKDTPIDKIVDGTDAIAAFESLPDRRWFFGVRACDVAGNWSEPQWLPVRIDTTGPTVAARGDVRARRGTVARLPFWVSDNLSRQIAVSLLIRRNGRTVSVSATKVSPGRHSRALRCTFPKGDYVYVVQARDEASNAQRAVGRGRLVIW